MSAILAFVLSNPTIIGIGVAFLGALGFGFQQRLAGAKAERNKQRDEEVRVRNIADQVDSDIGSLPPETAREDLRRWSKS